MADLVGKLGQTIKGSVSGFGAGFKQAAIGGNPALFGAALGTMEKAFSKKFDEDKKERAKDREERRRDRQFDEEKENEQKKVDSDILKSLRNMEKLLEALLGKKGDKGGGFFAALLGNLRKLLGPLLAGLTAFLASLDDVLSDILKAFSGWAKKLAGKGLGIIDDLLKAFNNFFRNIFDKIKSLKIGAFVDDLLQNFKNFFKGLFDRFKATSFGKFIDEALKSVKGFFTNLFTQISKLGRFFDDIGKNIDDGFKALKAGRIAELIGEIGTKIKSFFGSFFDDIAKKVPKIFDVEVDLFKRLKDVFKAAFFEGRLIQSLDDLAEVFSSKGVLGKFAATLGLVFETLKTGVVDKVGDVFSKMGDFFKGIAELPIVAKIIELGEGGLKKIFKAIPVIGNLIMVIEGIFEAFDTESLADSLQKAQKDIGFGDRVVGFLGGLIGSIFGILDLIPMAIKALFGIDMAFEDGETIQKKATRLITGFIGDFFGYFSGLFTLIGGLLTADSVLMKKGLLEMELIVEDWLFGFKNFFGGIIKVPFAKMTNTVAGAIEYMVNGIIGAMNDFVAFVLDKLAVIPGAGGLAGRAKEALRVEKITLGRMDESPYKPEQSRRRVAAEKIRELEKTEAAEAESKKKAAAASKGSSAATAGGAGKLTSEAQYALDYFMNAGFTPAQAAGLVSNLQAESGASLNTKAVGDAGTAFGIAQWRGDRAARFKSMYGKDVVNSSLDEQLSYVLWELSNTEKSAGAKLRGAKTEAEAAAIVDQYYERSSGAHRDRRVAGAGMLLASYKPSSGAGTSTSTIPSVSPAEKEKEKEIVDAITILPNQNNEQIDLMQEDAKRQVQYREEDNKYQKERDALQERFHDTLRRGYENILTRMAGPGGFGSTAEGGARSAVEKAISPTMQKIGTKIFGKEMGGEIGQIFTQLGGNYAEQIATQILGPMLFRGDGNQANRFFNSLASGDKKAAKEDLLKGMFGINTGIRSALGYESGMKDIARDLAIVTGTPFDNLFNIDPTANDSSSKQLKDVVSDPIVDATYEAAHMIIEAQQGIVNEERRRGRVGGGGVARDSKGNIIQQDMSPAAARGRLVDKGFDLLGLKAGQGLSKALGVGDSSLLSGVVQGMTQDFIKTGRTGGDYTLMGSLGRTLGLDVGPNPGAMEIIQGISNASSKLGRQMGDEAVAMVKGMGGSDATANMVGDAVSGAFSAYSNVTLKKSLSGEFEVSKGMSTFQDVGIAIASFINPVLGTIVALGSAFINRAFGMGKKRTTGTGLTGTLGEDESAIQNYADWHQKGGWFRSNKSGTNYSAADFKLVKGLTDAAKGITTSIRTTAREMGMHRDPTYMKTFLAMQESFSLNFGKLNLMGKNEREQQEELLQLLEDYGDAFLEKAFGETLDKFVKAGETLTETFDRLAAASINFNNRMMMFDYSFTKLFKTTDLFELAAINDQFIEFYGGMEKFVTGTERFFEVFYTNEEKQEYARRAGEKALADALYDAAFDEEFAKRIREGATLSDTFEDARKAYRKIVEDFAESNKDLLASNDENAVKQLSKLQNELAASYYTTANAIEQLDRIRGTSKEALTDAARALFDADIAATGRAFATGGVAMGPKTGYAALLHGTEAVIPLPNSREIPVELKFPKSELGMNRTFINNVIGNGNASVRSNPTNVISATPMATSGSSANRVLTPAY